MTILMRCTALLTLLAVASPGLWTVAREQATSPASVARVVEALDPQGADPGLKFRIGHEHKELLVITYCYGDLYVSANAVRLEVFGPYRRHSFDVPRTQISGVKRWRSDGVEIKVKRKKYHVLVYPLDAGKPQQTLLFTVVDPSYTNPEMLLGALNDFPAALERVRAGLPKPPPPPEPPKPPGLIILEPAGAPDQAVEVTDEQLTVRGVALDEKGIALVRVGTQVAAMKPRSPQAMEFWLEDVPLVLGENQIEVVATSAERLEGRVVLTVRRVAVEPPQPPKPTGLSLENVVKLLEAGVTPVRLATLVRERGVGFELTDETEQKLRAAGATDELLLEIAKAQK